MYEEIKANSMTEKEAVKIVGEENIEAVKAINCEFSNRLIDDVYNVVEFASIIECEALDGNDVTLTMLYLVDADEVSETDDLGNLNWDRYTFVIE